MAELDLVSPIVSGANLFATGQRLGMERQRLNLDALREQGLAQERQQLAEQRRIGLERDAKEQSDLLQWRDAYSKALSDINNAEDSKEQGDPTKIPEPLRAQKAIEATFHLLPARLAPQVANQEMTRAIQQYHYDMMLKQGELKAQEHAKQLGIVEARLEEVQRHNLETESRLRLAEEGKTTRFRLGEEGKTSRVGMRGEQKTDDELIKDRQKQEAFLTGKIEEAKSLMDQEKVKNNPDGAGVWAKRARERIQQLDELKRTPLRPSQSGDETDPTDAKAEQERSAPKTKRKVYDPTDGKIHSSGS